MTTFNEANAERGFEILKGLAVANGAGTNNRHKLEVNADLIINALVHTPGEPVTISDAAEIKRRFEEWKASLPSHAIPD